jgi:predicted secreted protein
MAFVHGKNTAFKLDNAAGSIVDLSAYLTDVSFPESVETTTFGATGSSKTYLVGLNDRTVSLSGNWDATLDAHIAAVIAAQAAGTVASSTFEYGPAGSTAGLVKYSGEALVTSFEVSNPVGDVVTFSCELQVTGAVTRGTWS